MSRSKLYNTDTAMKNVWRCLVRDFRSFEGHDYHMRAEESLACMTSFRAYTWPTCSTAPAHLFKQEAQLQNLFKRYRFKEDVYTDQELDERTFSKFLNHQLELATPKQNFAKETTFRVLQRARILVKDILGEYSLDEHVEACRFGVNANMGIAARDAYLDQKFAFPTGSEEHITWFQKHAIEGDKILSDMVDAKILGAPVCVDSLKMVNVAKSWKIKRGIIPDTVLGSFYTNGIGLVFENKLRTIGLDIRRLQDVHRKLAQKFSKTRSHVTADLSNASNSFTWGLMCRLLPRKWLKVLDYGRIRNITYNGVVFQNTSFMMMGIGYTFTVQTLLFYCLIKAIKDLLGYGKGFISVYGDDLIYPRAIHSYVVSVFADIGFTMNADKTYVRDHFRESCGGDFYRRVDVRPYQPEGECQVLKGKPYVLFLYKMINGLLERWDQAQIEQTLRFLLLEILRVDSHILLVPGDYPDFSGIHMDSIRLSYHWPVKAPKLNESTGWLWVIPHYEYHSDRRIVEQQRPYYWNVLRKETLQQVEPLSFGGSALRVATASMKWTKSCKQPQNYRSKLTGKRLTMHDLTEAKKMATLKVVYHNFGN